MSEVKVVLEIVDNVIKKLEPEVKFKDRKQKIGEKFLELFDLPPTAVVMGDDGFFRAVKRLELSEEEGKELSSIINMLVKFERYLMRSNVHHLINKVVELELGLAELDKEVEESLWALDYITRETTDDYESAYFIGRFEKRVSLNYIAYIKFRTEEIPIEDC